jgi:hypothetical protein
MNPDRVLSDRQQAFVNGWMAGHAAALDYISEQYPDLTRDFDEPGDNPIEQTKASGERLAESIYGLLASPAPRRTRP